jgi:purine-binding chemotaxis protein CheW
MSGGDEIQLVAFRVADHEFAFNVFQVERILRFEKPTPLPKSPDYLEGTVQYGDEVVPVVDLRKRLEVAASEGEETRIVIVSWEEGRIGIVVDAVLEVLKIPADEIKPPPGIVRGLAADYINGILPLSERTLVVLAVSKLLTSEERIALDALTAEMAHE